MTDLPDHESGGPAQRRRRRTWTSATDSATRPAPTADPVPPSSGVSGSLLSPEQRERVIGAFRAGANIHGAAEQVQAIYLDVQATMRADPAFALAVRQAKGASRGDIRMALRTAVVEKGAHGIGLSLLRVDLDEKLAREAKRQARAYILD